MFSSHVFPLHTAEEKVLEIILHVVTYQIKINKSSPSNGVPFIEKVSNAMIPNSASLLVENQFTSGYLNS